jgi:hypothetical protein
MDDYIKHISTDVKEDIVRKYIDLDWDYTELFHNRNISEKFIIEFYYKFPGLSINGKNVYEYSPKESDSPKDYKKLTRTTNIKDIMEFPVIIWDWDWLTRNTDIQIISKYINCKYWNWEILSEISDFETIYNNLNWHWHWLILSKKATKNDVIKYPDFKWDLDILAKNKDIVQSVNLKWSYYYNISKQPWLDLDYICDNWDENWNWYKLESRFTLDALKNIHKTKLNLGNCNLIGFNDECMICLDLIKDSIDPIVVLKCLHQYHQECLEKWRYKNNSCPLCKHPIENDKFQQWMYHENKSESEYESDDDDYHGAYDPDDDDNIYGGYNSHDDYR